MNAKIDELHARSLGDEVYISEIFEWINDNIAQYETAIKVKENGGNNCESARVTFCRYWIYSHHIYSNEKRRNMALLSANLGLNGFILPGKPGIICVEGIQKDVQEFYSHIKR